MTSVWIIHLGASPFSGDVVAHTCSFHDHFVAVVACPNTNQTKHPSQINNFLNARKREREREREGARQKDRGEPARANREKKRCMFDARQCRPVFAHSCRQGRERRRKKTRPAPREEKTRKKKDEEKKGRRVRMMEKGGWVWGGLAVMTETAMTAETAKTVKTATIASLCCIW